MVCGNRARFSVGPDRVPLCGVHRNQLQRMAGGVLWGIPRMSRVQIRSAFGFLIPDDTKSGLKTRKEAK
jgi:hypothetical protein